MEITGDEVRRIARLAQLELDAGSVDRMAAELTKIVTYIDQLRDIDLADTPQELVIAAMPLRDDEPRPSIDRGLAENNAPAWSDGCFVVPKVIGGE